MESSNNILRWRKKVFFCLYYSMVYMSNAAQCQLWSVSSGFDFTQEPAPSLCDGKPSQTGVPLTDSDRAPLKFEINIGPTRHYLERICQTVGGTQFCEELPSLVLERLLSEVEHRENRFFMLSIGFGYITGSAPGRKNFQLFYIFGPSYSTVRSR